MQADMNDDRELVTAMLAGDEQPIDEQHLSLVALRVELRDRLRGLVAWARQTGRI